MTDISRHKVRSWERRAMMITRKMGDLMTDMHEYIAPNHSLELSLCNQSARLVDELDMLVVNLGALAVQTRKASHDQ